MYCRRCNINYEAEEYWDENGYGYSTKLVECPNCGNKVIVKFEEDYALFMMGKIGMDPRYYKYEKE